MPFVGSWPSVFAVEAPVTKSGERVGAFARSTEAHVEGPHQTGTTCRNELGIQLERQGAYIACQTFNAAPPGLVVHLVDVLQDLADLGISVLLTASRVWRLTSQATVDRAGPTAYAEIQSSQPHRDCGNFVSVPPNFFARMRLSTRLTCETRFSGNAYAATTHQESGVVDSVKEPDSSTNTNMLSRDRFVPQVLARRVKEISQGCVSGPRRTACALRVRSGVDSESPASLYRPRRV